MSHFDADIYEKLKGITEKVSLQLQKRGIYIPTKNNDGTIKIGNFTIVKNDEFYEILDHTREPIVDKINLPHTAAILANNLALGRFLDTKMLEVDRAYGYAAFEETLYKKLIESISKTDSDKAYVMKIKCKIKHDRKVACKQEILKGFEKLRKLA